MKNVILQLFSPRLLLAGLFVLSAGVALAAPPRDTATERFLRHHNEWPGRLDASAMTSRKTKDYLVRSLSHLHVAARLGDLEAARWLLDNGAKMESRTRAGFTPLQMAVLNSRADSVKYLIERGADVHAKVGIGMGVMHLAAGRGAIPVAEVLLRAGADINLKHERGTTPLDFAILIKRPKMEAWLRKNGAKCGTKC